MKKAILVLAAAGALALGTVSAAAPYHWELVGGTGQSPEEFAETYCDCDVLSVFRFDPDSQAWLTWHGPESDWILQLFNDDFTMEPGQAYWVACK